MKLGQIFIAFPDTIARVGQLVRPGEVVTLGSSLAGWDGGAHLCLPPWLLSLLFLGYAQEGAEPKRKYGEEQGGGLEQR